mgnify:CR=1 FL=1
MSQARAQFHWDDPLLLDQQLTDEERMIRDAANAYIDRPIRNLDAVFQAMLDYLIATPFLSIAMAQTGDYIGAEFGTAWRKPLRHLFPIPALSLLAAAIFTLGGLIP